MPPAHPLPDRLGAVLAAIYLIFNEGYGGRRDLADEAIRLGRVLTVIPRGEAERPQHFPWDVVINAAQVYAVEAFVALREAQLSIPMPEPALKARLEAAQDFRSGLESAIAWVNDEIGAIENKLASSEMY